MRSVALLLIAGCGRIGLDAAADAPRADAPVDAAPFCAGRPDGTPCDDRNICTATSVCVAGACGITPAPTCQVADSMADFTMVQGANGWRYGFWDISADADGVYAQSELQELVELGNAWRPPDWAAMPDPHFTWAYLLSWGGHPGSYPIRRAPIRRWTSTVAGDAIVRVSHAKADTSGGDGTRAVLVVDGVTLLARDVAGDDGVGFVEDVPVTLAIGSQVDLMLHYIGDDAIDTTNQRMVILSR